MEGIIAIKTTNEVEGNWDHCQNPENSTDETLSGDERKILEQQEDDFDKLIRAASELDAKEIVHLRNLFYFVSSSCGKVPLRHKRTIDAKQAQYTLRQCGFDAPALNLEMGTLDIPGLGNFARLTVRTFLQIAGLMSVERADRIQESIFNRGKERAYALFRMMDPADSGKVTTSMLLQFLSVTGVKGHTNSDAELFCIAVSRTNQNWFGVEDLLWYIERRGAILRCDPNLGLDI